MFAPTFGKIFPLSSQNYLRKLVSTPNVKAQEYDSRYKYSMINKTPRDMSTQYEEKEQMNMRQFKSHLEDYLITHCIHYKSVKSAINPVPIINIRH